MAYRKFARRSYRRRSRRRFRRSSMFRRVRRIAFGIAEKKYYDYWFAASEQKALTGSQMPMGKGDIIGSAFGIPIAFSFGSLFSMIQQGVGANQRIGNRIRVEYIQIVLNLGFLAPSASNDSEDNQMRVNGCVCRYVVIRTKGMSGPTTQNPYGSGVMRNAQGLKDPAFMRNRKTILDRQVRMAFTSAPTQPLTTGSGVPIIQHYIPVKRTVQYSFVADPEQSMTITSNMMDNDYEFGITSNAAAIMCTAAVGIRVCFRDA